MILLYILIKYRGKFQWHSGWKKTFLSCNLLYACVALPSPDGRTENIILTTSVGERSGYLRSMNGWHNCADPSETFLNWVYFDTILQDYKQGNQGEVNPHSSDHPRRIELTVQRIKFSVTIIIIVLKDIGWRKDCVWNLLGVGCRTEEIPTDVSTQLYFFNRTQRGLRKITLVSRWWMKFTSPRIIPPLHFEARMLRLALPLIIKLW